MSLTTTQFANDYVNALVAQGVALSNAAAFKTTFANQLTAWLGGADAIPADLAYRLTEALARINAETTSRLDWLTGTVNGGPNNNGYYPATTPDGSTILFPCLAKMLAVLQAAAGVTNLSMTRTATAVAVLSDTGGDATLPAASSTLAGVMTAADKAKLDGITGTGGSGSTNLSFTRTSDTVTIVSDTGTDAILPVANVDSAGIMSAADKTKLDGISPGGQPPISRGAITGLTLANDGTSPNTHVTIATGQARSSTDAFDLRLTTGLVKRLDQAWAIGTNNGALDTGSVAANTGYHVFLIRRTSDGVLDVLMSTSATNPTLPSGFGAFRRLGAVLTDASGFIRKFVQRGDYFELYTRTADFAGVANGAGPYLRQMVCPKGVPIKLRVYLQSQNGTQLVTFSGIFDPALGVPQLATLKRAQIRRTVYRQGDGLDAAYGIFDGDVWCDANGQVYTHSDNASDIIALGIYGWTDERGQYQ
jgi:hypothetical protein